MNVNVADWLRGLGLERYESAFRDNEIDADILPSITAEDLREIGVAAVGHRRRLLDAIAALGAPERPRGEVPGEAALLVPAVVDRSQRTESERRQLTILFCDLVGSTQLSEELDPEDFRDVLIAYKDAVTGIVTRFDGFVARYLGDGVLAYFGWPQAYEYDAERAVRAGLEMTEAVAALGRVQGRPLSCRVGIATGPVIVGDLVGSTFSDNDQVVGRTPNLAARIQTLTQPGTVAISPETHSIVERHFAVSDIGMHRLKGLARATRIWRVDRIAEDGGTGEDWRPWRTSMVSRRGEMSRLEGLWAKALQGHGRAVIITGEPGIGKSRLIGEMARAAAQSRTRVVTYQCSPFHANDTLYPVLRQLRIVARSLEEAAHKEGSGAPLGDEVRQFSRLFAAAELDVEPTRELLGPLLGLPDVEAPIYAALDAQGLKEKRVEALFRIFHRFVVQQGGLVLIEDLHWADPTTRELIERLLREIDRMPLLLLMTARPHVDISWADGPNCEVIELTRLTSARIDEIVAQVAGDMVLPGALRALIAERSDGVPLFAEELTKSVMESDVLDQAGGSAGPEGAVYQIPMTLRDSLISRIDRLPEARPILQTAATIGREFSSDLLTEALDRAPRPEGMPHKPDADWVREGLAHLTDAGLVVPDPSSKGVFTFRHALLRDAAYDSMLRSERMKRHRQIAEVLSTTFADSTPQHVTASHWARCDRHREAARCFAVAAATSMARYANSEAAAQFRSALFHLDKLRDPSGAVLRADLREDLGRILILMNDVDGATDVLTDAIDDLAEGDALRRARLYRLIGKAQQQNRDASLAALDAAETALTEISQGAADVTSGLHPDAQSEWIDVQLNRLYVHYWSGDSAAMAQIAERLAPVIENGSAEQRAEYFDQLALRDLRAHRYVPTDETVANARRFVEAAHETDDLALQASARFMLGFVLMHGGALDAARAEMNDGLETARRSGHRAIELRCLTYLATTARRQGQIDAAAHLSETALDIATRLGMNEYVALAHGNLGWAAWRRDHPEEAQRCGMLSLGEFERSHIAYPFEWGAILPLIASYTETGQAAEACDLCARLIAPDQQRLPDALDTALREAAEAGGNARATALEAVIAAARQTGYL